MLAHWSKVRGGVKTLDVQCMFVCIVVCCERIRIRKRRVMHLWLNVHVHCDDMCCVRVVIATVFKLWW